MVLAPLLGATGMAKIITLTSDAGLAATISRRTGGTGSPVPSRRREPGDGVVERARAGDDRAWIEIIDRYQPLLRWIAARYRLSSQDAADVIQVTWLRCIEHVGELHDAEAFGVWLATICRRESARWALRLSSEVLMADPDECRPGPADARDDPCDEIVRRDERQRLYEAIADLPVRQAAVLIALIEHDAEGYAEISRRLGLPIGSLGPTRRRALQRLRTDPRLASGSRTSQRPEPAAATRSSA